jgi:hypothetical protein
MPIADYHVDGLSTSTALSAYYLEGHIAPRDVIVVLTKAKVPFMLVGAHALSGWTRKPRATEDVDVLVSIRYHKKAVRALLQAFPHLEVQDLPIVTRLRDPATGKVVIDVMKPLQQPYVVALKHAHLVETEGYSYKIPVVELALVMKFSAMTSVYRGETEKLQDAHDFRQIIEVNPQMDIDKLREFADLIYPEGGKDITDMVRRVREGGTLFL